MCKNRRKKKKFVKYSRAYDNPPVVYIFFIIMGLVLAFYALLFGTKADLLRKTRHFALAEYMNLMSHAILDMEV